MSASAPPLDNIQGGQVFTSVDLDCSCDRAWAVLTDFNKYPEWASFVKSIDAPSTKVGETWKVVLGPKDKSTMTFTPVVRGFFALLFQY